MKHKPLPYPQTQESAYAYFYARGINISQWSKGVGVSHEAVKNVLLKRCKGLRGHGHDAAVALGLKQQPKD